MQVPNYSVSIHLRMDFLGHHAKEAPSFEGVEFTLEIRLDRSRQI